MDIFALFKKIETGSDSNLPITHMLVGLGNPGDKYKNTRHNMGFLSLEYVANKENISINRSKFKALVTECTIGDKRTLVMLPQTFMNNSGQAVQMAASFYKIPVENIVVVYDDISLDVGKMRIRKKGSDGGHNGIKSITEHLSSQNFPRIKVGVGAKPHKEMDLADWVLSNFTCDDVKKLENLYPNIHEAVKLINGGNIDMAMNKFNS